MSNKKLFNADSANSKTEREQHDYYATPPEATQLFLDNFKNMDELDYIWEPACGGGHMSEVLKDNIIIVKSTDLIDRNYADELCNFLDCTQQFEGHIITNPPFSLAQEFVDKSMQLIKKDKYCIMFLRIQFMETIKRKTLFEKDIHSVYIHSRRVACAKGGDFTGYLPKGIAYAWFVFKKGHTEAPKLYWL